MRRSTTSTARSLRFGRQTIFRSSIHDATGAWDPNLHLSSSLSNTRRSEAIPQFTLTLVGVKCLVLNSVYDGLGGEGLAPKHVPNFAEFSGLMVSREIAQLWRHSHVFSDVRAVRSNLSALPQRSLVNISLDR